MTAFALLDIGFFLESLVLGVASRSATWEMLTSGEVALIIYPLMLKQPPGCTSRRTHFGNGRHPCKFLLHNSFAPGLFNAANFPRCSPADCRNEGLGTFTAHHGFVRRNLAVVPPGFGDRHDAALRTALPDELGKFLRGFIR